MLEPEVLRTQCFLVFSSLAVSSIDPALGAMIGATEVFIEVNIDDAAGCRLRAPRNDDPKPIDMDSNNKQQQQHDP